MPSAIFLRSGQRDWRRGREGSRPRRPGPRRRPEHLYAPMNPALEHGHAAGQRSDAVGEAGPARSRCRMPAVMDRVAALQGSRMFAATKSNRHPTSKVDRRRGRNCPSYRFWPPAEGAVELFTPSGKTVRGRPSRRCVGHVFEDAAVERRLDKVLYCWKITQQGIGEQDRSRARLRACVGWQRTRRHAPSGRTCSMPKTGVAAAMPKSWPSTLMTETVNANWSFCRGGILARRCSRP